MTNPQIDLNSWNKAHWSVEDKQRVEKVLEFVQLIMNDHNFEEVVRRYSGTPYKQHNRNIADGIDGVVNAIRGLVKTAPEFSYDVKQVYVDGEYVCLHSHATLKAKHRGDESQGLNIIDTWKVVDGQLVEHWDAVQGMSFFMRLYSLLTGGKIRNKNSVF